MDNARDAEQVRPLLHGSAGCLVVITSRHQLPALVTTHNAHPMTLDLLTMAEATQLLARRLGAKRVAAEPHAVDEIITLCARLPLALAIVAARAATHPEITLAVLAAELRNTRDGLDAFAGDDAATDVRAVFSWSYRAVSRLPPGCSGCWACIPARTSGCRQRQAWPTWPRNRCARCSPSWTRRIWSASTSLTGTPATICCAPTPASSAASTPRPSVASHYTG